MNVIIGLLVINLCLLLCVVYLVADKNSEHDKSLLPATLTQLRTMSFRLEEIQKEYSHIAMDLKKISNNCTDIKIDVIKMRPRRYTKRKENL